MFGASDKWVNGMIISTSILATAPGRNTTMNKWLKLVIALIIVAALGTGTYYIVKKIKGDKKSKDAEGGKASTSAPQPAGAALPEHKRPSRIASIMGRNDIVTPSGMLPGVSFAKHDIASQLPPLNDHRSQEEIGAAALAYAKNKADSMDKMDPGPVEGFVNYRTAGSGAVKGLLGSSRMVASINAFVPQNGPGSNRASQLAFRGTDVHDLTDRPPQGGVPGLQMTSIAAEARRAGTLPFDPRSLAAGL